MLLDFVESIIIFVSAFRKPGALIHLPHTIQPEKRPLQYGERRKTCRRRMGRFWQLKFRLELREEDRPSLAQALALALALSLTLALALSLAFALALALAQASALAQVFIQILLQREGLFWKNQGANNFVEVSKGIGMHIHDTRRRLPIAEEIGRIYLDTCDGLES